MEVTELFSFIKDFGFPVVLSWFLVDRMENKLVGLTNVIGVSGGQNSHSNGGEKQPILGKLRNQQLSSLNLFSIRFA